MCDFAIRDAYPQAADFSVDEDDGEEADLDIDSDTSDADLLELKQELEKLGTKKARRDLADTIITAQEIILRRWERLHDFVSPDGRITIDFAFKDDILEIPIFRRSTRSIEGIHVDPRLALSANSISSWTKRLGQRAGFSHPFQPYALRRDVGTELTDRGVSDQQRNQILGHARSDTFLKHYISSNVVVDVQATFLGTASRADLIKEIGKLYLRRDPNLPKQLSDHQRTQAYQRPDIIRIR
ncbi:MAG: hypothetical protein LQ352_000136 [Teloschistes flavicans]|nr:MAG: hypothetical protein LQ352_000136 [Teloschistes flavicans]